MSVIHSGLRVPHFSGGRIQSDSEAGPPAVSIRGGATPPLRLRAVNYAEKPPICTADELHYVPVSDSGWEVALWRYSPPPDVRQNPLFNPPGLDI